MLAIDHWAWNNRWCRHHPGERLLLAGGLLVLTLILPPLTAGPLILAVAALMVVAGAGVPLLAFLKVMAVPAGFLATSVPMLALSLDFSDGLRLSLSGDGLMMAAMVALRSLAAMACLALLILTTPVVELLTLARRAGLPVVIAELALLIYHLLFALIERAAVARRAQAARHGYDRFACGIRSVGILAATLFQRALERGRRLELGLAARGYDRGLAVLTAERPWSRRRLLLIAGLLVLVALAALGGERL